ncbi:MAG TPA: AMP-binding protein [Pyrinomonadaceae bacterium]|jgi:phenylacetate-CoA ligase|nr:AMP-binding protein [Pyrinomonadaceae bacterium]
MNRNLLQLYHRSPAPLRSVAASLRGYQLRAWRYGRETERLVEEAIERERWGAERWRQWRGERLARVLHRAATQVPFYREQWAGRRRRGDRASWELLANWPVLEKESVRQTPRAFLADGCDVRRMFHDHTSGTTGKSLDLWLSRRTVRAWYALCEARLRHWYGVSRRDRWAILGGQLVVPAANRRPPFWVWNAALRQLYMSSYHLAPDLIPHYLDALRRYRVRHLLGYPSSLYALAQGALSLGRGDLKMAVVVTNAEPVYAHQRRAIAEAFQCPVRETYGMSEIVAAASECEDGRLHMWHEAGVVEILAGGRPAGDGAAGELVCTGLMNEDMPLIRYRVGDRGARAAAADGACACGRTLPVLASVEGRTDDLVYTADGRRIPCIDTIYDSRLHVREAQIVQETLARVRVRYVPAPGFTHESGGSIIRGVRERMGAVEVVLEQVDEIPRGANGKFRAIVCNLPAETRERIEAVGT